MIFRRRLLSALVCFFVLLPNLLFASITRVNHQSNNSLPAIARIQFAHNACDNCSSVTVTLSSAPVNGNTVFVGVSALSGDTVTVTETGASFTLDSSVADALGTGKYYLYRATNVSGASTSVVISTNASHRISAIVTEYSGIITSSPLDKTATNSNAANCTQTTLDTGTTAATTQASEVWIAVIGDYCQQPTYSSPTNGFTIVDQTTTPASNGTGIAFLEKLVGATGTANTAVTVSATTGGGNIATYKGNNVVISSFNVTVPAPTNSNLLTLGVLLGDTSGNNPTISSITETGATWIKSTSNQSGGNDIELWSASNVSGAGTTITVTLSASLNGGWGTVYAEYSGTATSPSDVTANAHTSSTTTLDTGTTAATSVANELWFGSVWSYNTSSAPTLSNPTNSFVLVDQVTFSSPGGKYFAIGDVEKIVSSIGTANCKVTSTSTVDGGGVIATFKTPTSTPTGVQIPWDF